MLYFETSYDDDDDDDDGELARRKTPLVSAEGRNSK